MSTAFSHPYRYPAMIGLRAGLLGFIGCLAAFAPVHGDPAAAPACLVTPPEQPGAKTSLVQKLEAIFADPAFARVPDRTFSAADFGDQADGKTVNTAAIQKAIDAANKAGGGVVTLPQGVNVSGALFLKSNVELHLDDGVTLQAVNDDAQYPDNWTRVAGIEMNWPAALVNIYGVNNVRVSGPGIIDGNGRYWWDKYNSMTGEYKKKKLRWAVDFDVKRVRPLVVYQSKNVLLKDLTIERSGFWTVTLTYSEQVHVDGIKIRNNLDGPGPSTDGIDTDSSSRVLIENCDVDCNDDNFGIKAGRDSDGLRVNRPAEEIVLRNSKTGAGDGVVTLGSETSGGLNNIEVYGMKGKRTAFGLRIKSANVRGGVVQNIYFHDSDMQVKTPFYCDLNWYSAYSCPPPPKDIPEAQWPPHWKVLLTPVTPPERGIPEVGHIWVENVMATGGAAFSVNAYPEKPIHDVSFKNVTIDAKGGGVIKNAANWTMTNVILRSPSQVKLESDTNVALPTLESPVAK